VLSSVCFLIEVPSVWASSIKVTLLLNLENHSNLVFFPIYLCPNGRYIDCLSLTHVTNEGEILKLHYKYYTEKRKNIKEQKKKFEVNIQVLMINSSHKDSNRKGTRSVFHHFCPGLPELFTLCSIR
jgi:hypothetical protein